MSAGIVDPPEAPLERQRSPEAPVPACLLDAPPDAIVVPDATPSSSSSAAAAPSGSKIPWQQRIRTGSTEVADLRNCSEEYGDAGPATPPASASNSTTVTITFVGDEEPMATRSTALGYGASHSTAAHHRSGGVSVEEVELSSHFFTGNKFIFKDGSTDLDMERLFGLQRYGHFRGAFQQVSLLMAVGTLMPALNASMNGLWLRAGLLAGVVSAIYFTFAILASLRGFGKIAGSRWETFFITLLTVQFFAIDFSEWARPKLDYGFVVMHFSFINNFTPFDATTMQGISVLGLCLYLLLKILRYQFPESNMLEVDDTVVEITSTNDLCIATSDLADVVIGMFVPCVLLMFQTYVTQRRTKTMRLDMLHKEQLKGQQKQLNHERKISEDVLRSMLPRQIIDSLKRCETVEPQRFQNVTVIFAEICHFGDLCAHLEPKLVVEVLNVIYLEFDRLSDLLRVYKVETVSQVYMAVVGCPEPIKNHADVAAHFALACVQALATLEFQIGQIRRKSAPGDSPEPVQCRVGLNSGRIRAGIVGLESPRYKLVGDTVNTASRMESTCEPGRVQASSSTADQLSKDLFVLEDRGEIQVKGKDKMKTFFIDGYIDPAMTQSPRVVIEGVENDANGAEGCSGQRLRRKSLDPTEDLASLAAASAGGPDGRRNSYHSQSSRDTNGNEREPDDMLSLFGEEVDDDDTGSVFSQKSSQPCKATASRGSSDMTPMSSMGAMPSMRRSMPHFAKALPALNAALKRDVLHFDHVCSDQPEVAVKPRASLIINSLQISALKSNEAMKHRWQDGSFGKQLFKSSQNLFLFVSPAYKHPEFLKSLQEDEQVFRDATIQPRIASARNRTLLWLLVISAACMFDYSVGLSADEVERYRSALLGRVVGNYTIGILYLLFLARDELFRKYAQCISIFMLWAQGVALLLTSVLVYNNEPAIIALYGVNVLSYTVCTIFQRLCICLAAVMGFLLIEYWRCDWDSVKSESATIWFLGTFFCSIACGIRLEEFMTHVAHYERRRLAARFEDIKVMKASGNELLNSLLPPHVVTLVRNQVSPIAEHHPNVTIIFTDIKGFTAYSAGLSPAELMAFLNSMYSAFDEVILNWGLYKVEIIGDAYFISSGCPVEDPPWSPDEGAMRAMEVALAMLRTMPQVCYDPKVQMRVGLHTGPVVAGVVGKKGPRFHLFGPTVVYAEKMESHGEAGRVHISDTTFQMLNEGAHAYEAEGRDIAVEGYEGLHKTWFINKSHCKAAGKLQRSLIVDRHRRVSKTDLTTSSTHK